MSSSLAVIAIVDDDPLILYALGTLLKTLGYGTELYDSAESLLAAAAQSKANCLMLDIEIGGSCGVDLSRHLAHAGYQFPIIFMSGTDDERVVRRAKEAGCVAFLRKPFTIAELTDALAKAGP